MKDQNIYISKDLLRLTIKELFDNGNKGLYHVTEKELHELYLNLASGFQIVHNSYDLDELERLAKKKNVNIITYCNILDFESCCDQHLYDFNDKGTIAFALSVIHYFLSHKHEFKSNDDAIVYFGG